MADVRYGLLEPHVSASLDVMASETGVENFRAPINEDEEIQIGHIAPTVFADLLQIDVQPDTITVRRLEPDTDESSGFYEEPFGIYDESQSEPKSVLRRKVGHIMLRRGSDGWALQQDPDCLVDIEDMVGFNHFWEVFAMQVQIRRSKQPPRNQPATN